MIEKKISERIFTKFWNFFFYESPFLHSRVEAKALEKSEYYLTTSERVFHSEQMDFMRETLISNWDLIVVRSYEDLSYISDGHKHHL